MARPLGSKNKRPSGISIRNRLAAMGIDLAEELLDLARVAKAAGDYTNANKSYDTLCKYSQVVPTAATESSGNVIELSNAPTEELLEGLL